MPFLWRCFWCCFCHHLLLLLSPFAFAFGFRLRAPASTSSFAPPLTFPFLCFLFVSAFCLSLLPLFFVLPFSRLAFAFGFCFSMNSASATIHSYATPTLRYRTLRLRPLERKGLGVSYLDDKMRAKSHLLAVKLFRPATNPPPGGGSTAAVGEVVLKWVLQVLGQFGMRAEDVAGAVTDAGVDVRGAIAAAFPWEWCVPHLLNRVATEGSGMGGTRQQSKNLPCRELVESMRGAVEVFNRSAQRKVMCSGWFGWVRARVRVRVWLGLAWLCGALVSLFFVDKLGFGFAFLGLIWVGSAL